MKTEFRFRILTKVLLDCKTDFPSTTKAAPIRFAGRVTEMPRRWNGHGTKCATGRSSELDDGLARGLLNGRCLRSEGNNHEKGMNNMNTIFDLSPWSLLGELMGADRRLDRVFRSVACRAEGRFPPVNVFVDAPLSWPHAHGP